VTDSLITGIPSSFAYAPGNSTAFDAGQYGPREKTTAVNAEVID